MFREPLPTLDDFQTLPGFRWTGPETKVDPDTQLALDFLVWCRGKDAGEEYDFTEPLNCAHAQFEQAMGRFTGARPASGCGCDNELPALEEKCLLGRPRTFGALADRLESSLSRRGRG